MEINNLTAAVIGKFNFAAVIHDLKPTKPTAKGQPRWRFSVSADMCGWTVGTIGWIYLPHAKAGYRVNPPRQGYARQLTGVGLGLVRAIERAVETKLAARTEASGGAVEEWDGTYTPEELEELEMLGMRGEL